jgi:ABC-type polysaccharide/polyol phosphate export permease
MNYSKQLYCFLKDIMISRRLIVELTEKDFKTRYLGSYLGILWAFIQPLITVIIFWFVFEVGFKSMPVEKFPFILWLISGLFPWFFLSDSIANATSSIMESSYLVKKVVFRVSILPVIKILSALVIHIFFIGIMFFMFYLYGYKPSVYSWQIVYYLFAGICLVLGLSWITSSLIIFFRDVGQIVGMVLQFGFWATPIFWNLKMVPEKYWWILRLNPAYYVVEGYRSSMIYQTWFWQDLSLTLYFWSIVVLVLALGAFTFRRLRPHFADVM